MKAVNLAAVFAGAGLPAPAAEHRFHPARRWRFDYAWPHWRVALEIDGGVWTGGRHTRARGFLGDMEKLNEAAILGWVVVRATPRQLDDGEAITLVERAMMSRGWVRV